MEARVKIFGHPIHQMLIVLPLGSLTAAVLFDVVHLLSGGEQWAVVSYWLIGARAYRVPAEEPESDGTPEWDATTVVVARAHGGGREAVGWSYTHASAAGLVRDTLAPAVLGRGVMDVPGAWAAMRHAVRNLGRPGLASMAIAAVDADGRSWEIPNLWICDGSLFPTGGGVDPSLTIQALACRIGDRIARLGRRGDLLRRAGSVSRA